jgi:hypothetical protein
MMRDIQNFNLGRMGDDLDLDSEDEDSDDFSLDEHRITRSENRRILELISEIKRGKYL